MATRETRVLTPTRMLQVPKSAEWRCLMRTGWAAASRRSDEQGKSASGSPPPSVIVEQALGKCFRDQVGELALKDPDVSRREVRGDRTVRATQETPPDTGLSEPSGSDDRRECLGDPGEVVESDCIDFPCLGPLNPKHDRGRDGIAAREGPGQG